MTSATEIINQQLDNDSPAPFARDRMRGAENPRVQYDFDVVTIEAEGQRVRLSEGAAREVLAKLTECFDEGDES